MDPTANLDWPLLLATTTRFATLLGTKPPPEAELRPCIERVLFDREALEAARLGLITQRELVDLLLTHLYEPLRDRSDVQPAGQPWLDHDLRRDLHQALFDLDE